MKELRDRVAVITGAGSGIGAALSLACGERGMRVVVVDVEGEAAEAVAQSVRDGGAEAFACQVDVRERSQIVRLADQVEEQFGNCHLLCNNAGVMATRPLLELEEKDWDWVVSVNLMGIVHAVSEFVPRMIAKGEEGHVVNTSSIVGLAAFAQMGLGAYTTTKFAVVGFSEFLQQELKSQEVPIGVSVVCPGAVATRIAQSERNRPQDLDTGQVGGSGAADPNAEQTPGTQLPEEVAATILTGVEEGDTWILTHPEMKPLVESRTNALMSAFDTAAARREN